MKDKTCLKKYIKPTIRIIEVKINDGFAISSVFNHDNEKCGWGGSGETFSQEQCRLI